MLFVNQHPFRENLTLVEIREKMMDITDGNYPSVILNKILTYEFTDRKYIRC